MFSSDMSTTIKRYTRKPVVVEAVFLDGTADSIEAARLLYSHYLGSFWQGMWLTRTVGEKHAHTVSDADFRDQFDPLPDGGETT